MRLFFIGMPGSGKSTVAKEFALSIDSDFIDIDEYIESKHKQKISEIFELYGETKFREFENLALKEIINKDNIVIATGGGLPCFYNNMQIMKEAGKTIYLKVTYDTLFNRIKSDNNIRPLIKNKLDKEVKSYLNSTLIEREKFYNQANCIIDADNDIPEILKQIILIIYH